MFHSVMVAVRVSLILAGGSRTYINLSAVVCETRDFLYVRQFSNNAYKWLSRAEIVLRVVVPYFPTHV